MKLIATHEEGGQDCLPDLHSTDSGNGISRKEIGAVHSDFGIDARVHSGRAELRIPAGLAFESWWRLGKQLKRISDSSAWWLADWLIYGEEHFPDRYQIVIEETSLSYQTLRNYAWVARKFPPSRRRDALSLQHHAETASRPEAEQDQWLARAEREGWSVARLRQELLRARNQLRGPDTNTRVQVTLNLDSERRDRWMQAAEAAQVPLTDWIVKTVDDATIS